MPNKESARKAIRVGVFVCGVLALVNFTVASFLGKSSWRDFDMSLRGVVLELAIFYVVRLAATEKLTDIRPAWPSHHCVLLSRQVRQPSQCDSSGVGRAALAQHSACDLPVPQV